MQSGSISQNVGDVLVFVVKIIAQVTRYPEDLLTSDAALGDDLGIDSVKQAEIVAKLAAELGVEAAAFPRQGIVTVGDVIAAVKKVIGAQASAPAVHVASNGSAYAVEDFPKAPVGEDAIAPRVVEIMAQVTRYPLEVLTLDAKLEDDLGIDSVKQAEIFAVIATTFEIEGGRPRDREMRTIGDVVALVRERKPARAASPKPVSAAVAPSSAGPSRIEPRPFSGKVALLTGSGRGIGRVMAERLAERGATVIVNSFHSREDGEATARAIRERGGDALHLWGSVANQAHLDGMFAELERRFGGLDLLVCNASNGIIGDFSKIRPEDWDRAFRTCVTGTYECVLRAAPSMQRRGGGSVVTMSTSMSQRYCAGLGSQGVVKAAVESLTRYLAAELAPAGVRVNCVAAGPVHGELLNAWERAGERIAAWQAATPDGTLCTPESVSEVVEFLLGSGSARMNGATLVVDGGLTSTVDGVLPRVARGAQAPVDAPARGVFANR